MRSLLVIVSLVLGSSALAAGPKPAASPTPAPTPVWINKDGFRITIPAGWKRMPEVEGRAKADLPDGSKADVIAYGKTEDALMVQVVWVSSKDEIADDIRDELEHFHDVTKRAGEATRYERTETGGAMRAKFEVRSSTDTGSVTSSQVAVAGVETNAHFYSWAAQCVYGDNSPPAAPALCAKILDSFVITVPEKNFLPIPAKRH